MQAPILFVSLLLLAAPAAASASADDETVGLQAVWKAELGAAYSRITVAAEGVITQYGDGEKDYVVALDAKDGALRWKHELGPVYRGHDGSEDGPVSTPVVAHGGVYALGPRGSLRALDLETGREMWSTHLVDELGAEAPEYGFTTSPLVAAGKLIVQAGGSEGRNLCAFDLASGALLWSAGEGRAAYQSPVEMQLLGRLQLVVLNGKELQGLDPEDGALLWSHALAEDDSAGSGSAGQIDRERFFAYVNGQLATFRLSESDAGFALEELYRSRELGNTYAKPVHHAGYLYGFKSTFLTCVDAQTGKRVWKSRPPGGRGLVLAGERLVVFGAEGVVAVVRATPEGYLEESRATALERSSYVWPTFAGGRVYVRNTDQLACLKLVIGGDTGAVASGPSGGASTGEHAFGRFVRELSGAPDAKARIDAFLLEQASLPVVADGHVHFVYRGEGTDVAVVGSMTGGSLAVPMQRVPGTDLFHRSFPIEAGARWEYTFQVDFDRPSTDPLNPRTTPGGRGPVSEVVTPAYVRAGHLAEPEGRRGRLESLEYTSRQLDNTRTLQVYLPPGYEEGAEHHPLLLVHDGPSWLEQGALRNSLDNLIDGGLRPVVVVFIAPLDEWWYESGGSRTEEYLAMLATELVPYLEERYRLTDDPAERALSGVRGFGLTAAYGVVLHPDVFGRAAVQSVSLEDVARHAFFERLAQSPPRDAVFYVDWSRYEAHDKDRGYDYGAYGPRLARALRESGCTVIGGEALDAHGWSGWSARSDAWLVALFGR